MCLVDSTSTSWLSDMKTLCTGSHDHHMTFTALETLLTLLSHENFRSVTRLSHDIKTAVDVLCPTISSITKDNTFIDVCTYTNAYTVEPLYKDTLN